MRKINNKQTNNKQTNKQQINDVNVNKKHNSDIRQAIGVIVVIILCVGYIVTAIVLCSKYDKNTTEYKIGMWMFIALVGTPVYVINK